MSMVAGQNPLEVAMKNFRPALYSTLFFSFFVNLLMFVGPLYMLQIYDRVLTSRSIPTLITLTGIALFLLTCYGVLEFIRSRVLVRAGIRFDQALSEPLFKRSLKAAVNTRSNGSAQSLRDMDSVREFWTGQGIITFCDAPWFPVFVAICFLMHFYLGVVALGGAIILFVLALVNELITRRQLEAAGRATIEANGNVGASFRNAEVIQALGMHSAVHDLWKERHKDVLSWQANASDRAGAIVAGSKSVRQALQIAILGVGGYLVIQQQLSAGLMIAASIMMGRALAPVEQAVGQWKSFNAARSAYARLKAMLDAVPGDPDRMLLPRPEGHLKAEAMFAKTIDGSGTILKSVSFDIQPGTLVGVIGPSAAGKSTLARCMVGAWPVAQGALRIDGSEIQHWDPELLGTHIGYLAQDVELFSGTIAQNIARLGAVDETKVLEAAQLAGVHHLVQQLPKGYDTRIGDGGVGLSGGQSQRIGLARALYGNPALIVLDEPNANLDSTGEDALVEAIKKLKAAGKTIIVITHKPQLLTVVDRIIVLHEGAVRLDGPRDEVLTKLMGPKVVPTNQQQPPAAKKPPIQPAYGAEAPASQG